MTRGSVVQIEDLFEAAEAFERPGTVHRDDAVAFRLREVVVGFAQEIGVLGEDLHRKVPELGCLTVHGVVEVEVRLELVQQLFQVGVPVGGESSWLWLPPLGFHDSWWRMTERR